MSLLDYLLLGLGTSVHCVAMCGGLVLSYSITDRTAGGVLRRAVPHLAYQSAKILSYMLVAVALGVVAALAGTALPIDGVRTWIMLGAGLFMILLGVGMTGAFPVLRSLTPRPPKALSRLISANRKRALSESAEGRVHLATPITFGLLTGLMPCAPLIAAQLGAMSSGSPWTGAAMMAAFGLGTAPLMLAFGVVSAGLGRVFRERLQIVAAVAVIVFGLVVFDRGLALVGSPVTFESVGTSLVRAAAPPQPAGTSTEVAIAIKDTTFVPGTVRIPEGRQVRLVVDRQEDDACSAQIAVPQLGVLEDLAPFAKTTVVLPPAKAGVYRLTCEMGMMSGQLIVGEPGATAGGYVAWVLVLVGVALAVLWLVRRGRRSSDGRGLARE